MAIAVRPFPYTGSVEHSLVYDPAFGTVRLVHGGDVLVSFADSSPHALTRELLEYFHATGVPRSAAFQVSFDKDGTWLRVPTLEYAVSAAAEHVCAREH